jgi:hypothetical protein
MKRPLAGALFAAGALSLSALGAAGSAQAETTPPGNVTTTTSGNQVTVTCVHPDDATLTSRAQINFVSLTPTSTTTPSYTELADITTIDAFATDAKSADPTLVNSADHVSSIEVKIYGNTRDALTGPPVLFDETHYNGTGKIGVFHFEVNRDHISYGTITVHWSKAGGAKDGEVLTCSYPNAGPGFPTGTGPNYG